MNPIYIAAMVSAAGRKIVCPKCAQEQVVVIPAQGKRYRCKKCLYSLTSEELKSAQRPGH